MNQAESTAEGTPPGSPLEGIVAEVLAKLRAAADAPEPKITCNSLIELLGPRSHVLAILVFSLLNLLPGPPGYSVLIGLAIMGFSVLMILGAPIRLWSFVGDRRLPVGLMLKLLEFLAWFTRAISNLSKPRFLWMSGRTMLFFVAIFAFLMGVAMLFPIPFTNTLPSFGLAVICVGILNRDGVAMMLGTVICLIGIAILYVCIWAIFLIGSAVVEEVEEAIH